MRTLPILLAAALAVPCLAKEPVALKESVEVTLFDDGGDTEPSKLKTAIIEMRAPSGQTVDLVGAIHIADQAYYDELNERFTKYDSVLYELVTDDPPEAGSSPTPSSDDGGEKDQEDPKPKKPDSSSTSAIRFFQVLLKNALGLTYQTEVIDYTPEHFVHADMSQSEFDASMTAKGESMQSIFEDAFRTQITMAKEDPDSAAADMSSMFTLFSGGDNSELKRDLGTIMVGSVSVLAQSFESKGESTLLGARNVVAVETLEEILAEEDPPQNIAIFYGAAHLPGIVDLLKEDGFSVVGTEWVTAWEIPVPEEEDETDEP